jgi:long-chain acyl-CoA synthetase
VPGEHLGGLVPEWGEQVKAIVQPSPGVLATPELADELLAWCRGRLASYKRPRSVELRHELPPTDSAKLAKRLLRDENWVATGRQLKGAGAAAPSATRPWWPDGQAWCGGRS